MVISSSQDVTFPPIKLKSTDLTPIGAGIEHMMQERMLDGLGIWLTGLKWIGMLAYGTKLTSCLSYLEGIENIELRKQDHDIHVGVERSTGNRW